MFEIQALLSLALSVVLFAVKVFALVDCAMRKPASFGRVETLSKNGWLIILGLAVGTHLLDWRPTAILSLLGTLGALVYLAQLRGSEHRF